MSFKHFSHSHPLIALQLEPGEKITCYGCESPILESQQPFHGCKSCSLYLHNGCLHAPRFLEHHSHPKHPLTLLPSPTYPSSGFICNACSAISTSFSYSCTMCEFDLDIGCAHLPKFTNSAAHSHHKLKLVFHPPNMSDAHQFLCHICGTLVDSRCWLYYCAICDFGAHVSCIKAENQMPAVAQVGTNAAAATEVVSQPSSSSSSSSSVVDPLKSTVNEMLAAQVEMMKIQNSVNLGFAALNIGRYRYY